MVFQRQNACRYEVDTVRKIRYNIITMYKSLSKETEQRIVSDRLSGVFYGTPDSAAKRLCERETDAQTLFRPPFVRDIAKIINLPVYSRMQDKTQVLSMYRNDDISRRMLHVQIVSRIARDISRALGLNVDLTEAIALGHDVGHTPFGHAGESMLDGLMSERFGLRFNHNVQSVRALTVLYPVNLTYQTLDGILCHNGELEKNKYAPRAGGDFDALFSAVAACESKGYFEVKKLSPHTIEGCVVRVSDIIAYLGKDRQDAEKLGLVDPDDFTQKKSNSEIINNISVDIIEHSYGKGCLSMSDEVYGMLSSVKRENSNSIYFSGNVRGIYTLIEPKFTELFDALIKDAADPNGFVARHHVAHIAKYNADYSAEPIERKVCDYIASMTDDYFIAAYEKVVGKPFGVEYREYF